MLRNVCHHQKKFKGARPEYVFDSLGRSCLHLAVEVGTLSTLEFLLQNSSDCSDGIGPLDKEDSTLLHHVLLKNPNPDICRLVVRKYPNSVTKRNHLGQLPTSLVK